MVTIGIGRDDPRRWVQAAYLLLDTAEGGETGPQGKLPTRSELAAKLVVFLGEEALRRLPEMRCGYHHLGS